MMSTSKAVNRSNPHVRSVTHAVQTGYVGCLYPGLALLLSLILLNGCNSNGDEGGLVYAAAQPISVPVRPGETEQVLFASNGSETGGSFYAPVDIDYEFTVTSTCSEPGKICWTQELQADATVQASRLGFFTIPFTGHGFLNDDPELNDGSYVPVSVFPSTTQTLPPATRVAAGGYRDRDSILFNKFDDEQEHSLVVAADGAVWAWGANQSGQLGTGDSTPSAVPVKVSSNAVFVAVAAGGRHSLALADDGTVRAWGDNLYGQLGDGTDQNSSIPVRVLNLDNVIAIAAGDEHSLALRADGSVWGWGRDIEGQLGDGAQASFPVPVQVPGLSNITAIAAGGLHSLALDSGGMVWGWGDNEFGQATGDSSVKQVLAPEPVEGGATAIAAGGLFSLMLKSSGTVWSWGSNQSGELGRPDSTCSPACAIDLARVSGLDQVLDIDAGEDFAIARRSDGSVWAWGDNRRGQVAGVPGLSTTVATQVAGLSNVISIAAGHSHAIAMQSDQACTVTGGRTGGQLLAWGDNTVGARGDGTAVNWFRPTPVVGIGDDSSCAGLNGYRIYIYMVGEGSGSVESDQPGLVCVGMLCWQSVSAGAVATLTATPDADSSFAEWNWDCAGQPQSMSLTMDSARTCKLRFNRGAGEPEPAPVTACNDGIDNDEDGLTDLEDPGCSDSSDDSEIDPPVPGGSFNLTVSINGEGEVFDNDDMSFFCLSDGTVQCVDAHTAGSIVSLHGVSFGVENVAIWTSGCDNGTGALENCVITMDADKEVTITMQ